MNRKWWELLWTGEVENKLGEIQWKIVHKCIALNDSLKTWGAVECEECTFCHREPETVSLIFPEGEITKDFWICILENRNIATNLDEKFLFHNGFNYLS